MPDRAFLDCNWTDASRSRMKYWLPEGKDILKIAGLALLLAVVLLAPAANAGELLVSYTGVTAPDAALQATVEQLRQVAGQAEAQDIGKVEGFFARTVKTFRRSLDPFQPWTRGESLTGHYLSGVADVMVEQGDVEPGKPIPDYRLAAAKMLAGLLPEDAVFGKLAEVPGAVCAPAAYKVNRKAALAFARRFELDGYSLRFFSHEVVLTDLPRTDTGRTVPANTLMMFDYDPKTPENWGRYETAGGVRGYMADRDDTLGLSQSHVCFAKVRGSYRIVAVFGYGL